MSGFQQTLDRIARSEDAVFAIDYRDRLVVWNRGCEHLLGHPADHVLGRPCYEVLGGRDSNGNVYCFPNCPVAYQARARRDDPVHSFRLRISTPRCEPKWVRVSMFVIPTTSPALGAVVHVLREEQSERSALEQELATEATKSAGAPVALMSKALGANPVVRLTPREKEILRCMAQAMTTVAMAARLGISPVTVRNHVQRILQKFGVHTKLSAVVLAYRNSLI
jgi:DNA-binding CsgD family transcriptional regulator